MVRFSDVIKIKDKAGGKKESLPEEAMEPSREEELLLSDSQVFTASEGNSSSEPPVPGDADIKIVTYHKKFLDRAIEIRERVKRDQGISPSPILSDLHYIIDNELIDEIYEYAMSTPDDREEMQVHTVEEYADSTIFVNMTIGDDDITITVC